MGRLNFIDSLQFVPQSLDSLVKTLGVDDLKYVREEFPIQHEFELIKRRWECVCAGAGGGGGVYPYDYMDSFASKLSDSPCSDMEYAHATQVWAAFECESMADYHNIYLKCDVLLLAELI